METSKQQARSLGATKILFIILSGLLLLIPLLLISGLVEERSSRKKEVSKEIGQKWGLPQAISGPVLLIPYEKKTITSDGKVTFVQSNLQLYPDRLSISDQVIPETLKRSIYKSVVYNSSPVLEGDFSDVRISKSGIDPATIKWNEARLLLKVSDLRGIKSLPELVWNGEKLETELVADSEAANLGARLDLSEVKSVKGNFGIKLQIKGSEEISFLPLAGETKIRISGKWGSPGFNGTSLPNERKVTKDAFQAEWAIQNFRAIPVEPGAADVSQSPSPGTKDVQNLSPVADVVIVTFLNGVDMYQQTTRTLKYGVLIIGLSFLALILTEVLSRKPFQVIHYGLIGAALVIFYTLLLSFSEHIGFNPAYLVAFLATSSVITIFVRSISGSAKTAGIFALILSLFFGFNYILMQLEDFSLLVGSLGLFLVLIVLMYFASKLHRFTESFDNQKTISSVEN